MTFWGDLTAWIGCSATSSPCENKWKRGKDVNSPTVQPRCHLRGFRAGETGGSEASCSAVGPLLLSLVDGNLLPKAEIFQRHLRGDPFRKAKSNETNPKEGQASRPIVPADVLKSQRSSGDLILANHNQLSSILGYLIVLDGFPVAQTNLRDDQSSGEMVLSLIVTDHQT